MTQTAEQPNASADSTAASASGSFEVLPGVYGTPPSSEAPVETPATPAADGGEATAADAGATATHTPPPAAPAPSGFRIGELEFENEEKAAHSIKTLRGMHRAMERKSEAARLEALEARQRIQELEFQLQNVQREKTAPPAPNGQPAGDQGKAKTDEPDWTVFNLLKEKHGDEVAQRWLQRTNADILANQLKSVREELEARLEERLQPLTQSFEEQQELQTTAELFQSLMTYRTQDGREYYPELRDEAVMGRVATLWKRLGFRKEDMLTARGMHVAIATYRDSLASQASSVAPTAPATTTSQAPAPATAVGNGADGPIPTRPPQPRTAAEQIRAETMAAAVSTNDLGFS